MGVHLDDYSSDVVVLDTELLDPLLVVGAGLVAHGHVLKLGFLGEVDVVDATIAFQSNVYPLSFDLGPLGDDVSASGLLLDQLVSS